MLSANAITLVAIGAITIVACGGDDGGGDPEDTIRDYIAGIEDEDGEAVCELFTEEGVDSTNVGADCEEGVADQFEEFGGVSNAEFDIDDSRVEGDAAKVDLSYTVETDDVTVRCEGTIDLVRVDDDWLIDREGTTCEEAGD